MPWPHLSSFQRHKETTRSCWGYSFEYSDEHRVLEQAIQPLKYSFDSLADEAYQRLTSISSEDPVSGPKAPEKLEEGHGTRSAATEITEKPPVTAAKRDLYILLQKNADKDPVLGSLWNEAWTVPSWVDFEKVARGQDVFYRLAGLTYPIFELQPISADNLKVWGPCLDRLSIPVAVSHHLCTVHTLAYQDMEIGTISTRHASELRLAPSTTFLTSHC